MVDASKTIVPDIENLSDEDKRDVIAFLYALSIIRRETGHGTIEFDVRDGKVGDMIANHKIRPKYI